MFRPRRRRVLVLASPAAALLAVVAVAYGATHHGFRGRTSQHEPISFRISRGHLRALDYRIVDHCPRSPSLVNHDYGFTPLRISHGKFAGTFLNPAHHGKATIRGTAKHGTVSGSLTDRTRNSKTHRICSGKAKFRVHRR